MSLSKRDELLLATAQTLIKLTTWNVKALLKEGKESDSDFEIMKEATEFFKNLTERLCEKYIPKEVRVEMEAKRVNRAVEKAIDIEIRKAKGEVF